MLRARFQLPLVPMDTADDARHSPRTRRKNRHDSEVTFEATGFIEAVSDDEEGYEETETVIGKDTSRRRQSMARKRSIAGDKIISAKQDSLTEATSRAATESDSLPALPQGKTLKNTPGFRFPRKAIERSRTRVIKASVSSGTSLGDEESSTGYARDLKLRTEYQDEESEQTVTKKGNERVSVFTMPEIEDLKINLTQYKVSDGNSTTGHDTESIDDNQSVTSQSGKQNTLARDFFEKEETGEDLLYPTLPSILAPSNRISHLHEDTDFNSPLVANWREQFATKKQVLTQMLNAQLDELEAERSIALKSKKLMSKAYKGALKDAHLATHDLTPKTFMIWQKAREDVLEESPDSEERIAFLKELDKQRKRLKKARLESHIMRDAFLTVKM
eukprot:TRINITY_DN1566_c0_g1_i14.p1 TRINITY_DN1566_c0_g1~~TRINITY_DN1566_c0_g1_i14.p1  ORF type:complete len:389 (+),score=90.18 TRINITY_DN1566_c0_g1_i14:53-1219(+)